MSVHKQLMLARVKLQSVEMKKSGKNSFQGYSYFELGDFIPHIQTIFHEVGLCGVVSFNTEYAQLCITDVNDGTVIVITSPLAEANLKGAQPIQLMGSCQTYQRRYLWMAAMELTEHDSIDSAPPVEAVKEQPKPTPVPELKAPTKHVKGRVDPIPPQYVETKPEWTMIIDAPDDEAWVDMMVDMNNLKIGMATDADQLKQMFQVNKPLYDKLKALNPSVYADVIDNFTKAKRSFF
jgi:hypothetical protein